MKTRKLNTFLFCCLISTALFSQVNHTCQLEHAQHCDTISCHWAGEYYVGPEYLIQADDGSLLCRAFLGTSPTQFYPHFEPYGTIYYKITRHGCQITDSLVKEDQHIDPKLVAHLHHPWNGRTDINVEARIVYDAENCRSDLRIALFDDNLNFAVSPAITVALADTIVSQGLNKSTFLLDRNDNIVVQYGIPSRDESRLSCFGLDGTLKQEKAFPSSILPLYYFGGLWYPGALRQEDEWPYNYYSFGLDVDTETFKGLVLDSLFNIWNTYNIKKVEYVVPSPVMYTPSGTPGMISLGEEGALVMRVLRNSSNEPRHIGVNKFDIEGNLLGSWFESVYDGDLEWCGVDLKRDRDGNIYLAAQPFDLLGPKNICYVIKLDCNLNPVYEHYFYHPTCFIEVRGMTLLDEGGVCIHGGAFQPNIFQRGLFVLVLDDEGVGINETDFIMRPYLLYPNPVKDQLHLHFSPNMAPAAMELYDLQGRIVRTQCSNLENIHMEDLPSGTYSLLIIMEDGATYADKVVKQ